MASFLLFMKCQSYYRMDNNKKIQWMAGGGMEQGRRFRFIKLFIQKYQSVYFLFIFVVH